MLAFSEDGNFLAVADEQHQEELLHRRFKFREKGKNRTSATLLALENRRPNKTGTPGTNRNFEVSEISTSIRHSYLERDRPYRTGVWLTSRRWMVDPDEVCLAHGIPHPLFTPKAVAMSSRGAPGIFSNPQFSLQRK